MQLYKHFTRQPYWKMVLIKKKKTLPQHFLKTVQRRFFINYQFPNKTAAIHKPITLYIWWLKLIGTISHFIFRVLGEYVVSKREQVECLSTFQLEQIICDKNSHGREGVIFVAHAIISGTIHLISIISRFPEEILHSHHGGTHTWTAKCPQFLFSQDPFWEEFHVFGSQRVIFNFFFGFFVLKSVR